MKFNPFATALVLALMFAGCTRGPGANDWEIGSVVGVLHGQVDFVSPPFFEWSFGSHKSVMCFDRSTVIRMQGTHLLIGAPYYVLLAGLVVLIVLPVVVLRFRKRRKREQ